MAKNAAGSTWRPCRAVDPAFNYWNPESVLSADHGALEARVTELEIKLSFAEDSIDSLNAAAFRQQQQFDVLVQEMRILRQQLQTSLPGEQRSLRDEIPPHY